MFPFQLADLTAALRRRQLACWVTMAITLASAVAMSIFGDKNYRATASILLQTRPIDPATRVLRPYMPEEVFQSLQLIEQAGILTSERVARQAVKELGLAESEQLRAVWEDKTDGLGDPVSWYGKMLLNSMEIDIPRRTTILSISSNAADPHLASSQANAMAKAYVEVNRQLRDATVKGQLAELAKQSQRVRQELVAAWQELGRMQTDERLTSIDALGSQEYRSLYYRAARQTRSRADLARLRAEWELARGRVDLMGVSGDGQVLIDQLVQDMTLDEAALAMLESQLGADHPRIRVARDSLESQRARIRVEREHLLRSREMQATVHGAAGAAADSQFDTAARSFLDRQDVFRKLAGTRTRIAGLTQQLSGLKLYGQGLVNDTPPFLPNVNVVNWAYPPAYASSPSWSSVLLPALGLGMLLCLMQVGLLEWADRRIHSAAALQRAVNLPVFQLQ